MASSGARPNEDASNLLANAYSGAGSDAVLWENARLGEPDDLARLYNHEGVARLLEHASRGGDRQALLGALGYAVDFTPLPWLAEQAITGDEVEGRKALDSIEMIVSRPRRPVDPEDAEELHDGCVRLLDLARAKRASVERRVAAVRILRMLVDRGCVKADDIPTDVDAEP